MRQRRIKNLEEKLAECSSYITENPKEMKGHWHEVFGNDRPIYLELGCGKGQFIRAHAERNPENNYIAVEGALSVVLRALEKARDAELGNITFILEFVQDLRDYFEDGELAGIYLNFSDPWPKDRHAKRRLTSRQFFARYDNILKKSGRVEFKTDNRDLFDFSVEEVKEAGWNLKAVTYDLHNDASMNEGNVCTEYELKFSEQGNPICKLIADR
ncbi:MAG: tRNA (guanosine(46)-N7)-methyltransferase TrmB [Eubacteriaceae bacterium]|nr:tRNA (guanosine(46)-N7)-methyltransferase TrmB [Eubacteriaceae bacterium]